MTTDETTRAEAFAKMTKSQRMAFIKQGATLNTTSSQRMVEKAKLVKRASQH